jgi:beta-N-acetylhexosaminidase
MGQRGFQPMSLRRLSLREKVGQLFMVGFEGKDVTPELVEWMSTYHWGGVIIFGRNVESPEQLHRLTGGLQGLPQGHDPLPLLVAVDQEGGRVARLKAPFTPFPSAAALGSIASEPLAYEVGRAMGHELRAVGINMDMAPVMDVLTNAANTVVGDRAFGAGADRVARLGLAFARGLRTAGVSAIAKHFPGHGDTMLDSHVALPVCERTAEQLDACELLPFRAAIAAGIQTVMTAHVVYPIWDAQRPATLSPAILQGILRQTLGFQGVILSDDLGMAAVAETVPWEEIPPLALQAGIDLQLICHDRQRQESAYKCMLNAVQRGDCPESLVDCAVTRTLELKAGLRRFDTKGTAAMPLSGIGNAAYQALVGAVHARGAAPMVERDDDGK